MEAAAHAAGVGVSSAYRWVARGRTGDPRFATLAAVSKEKGLAWVFGRVNLAQWNGQSCVISVLSKRPATPCNLQSA